MTQEEFLRHKAELDKLVRQLDRMTGAYHSTIQRANKEFGCNSIAELEKKLKTAEETMESLKKKRDSKLASFEKKWKDKLEELK